MNQTRMSIGILLIALMAAGWITVLGGQAGEAMARSTTVEEARSYRDRELYAMAIQKYEEALSEKATKDLYREYLETYDLYYAQSPTSGVESAFAAAMEMACKDYPKEEAFWERYARLYLDEGDYANAGKVLEKAALRGASSDTLEEQTRTAYYAFDVGYSEYVSVRPGCWDDCYVVETSDGWGMVTSDGGTVLSPVYPLMGPAGLTGQVLAVDKSGESWLMDDGGMLRAHYFDKVAEAGCWSEGLLPVRLEGEDTWCYLSDDGETVLSGYLSAGSFTDGLAAVETAEGWQLIDENGEAEEGLWEEIRLDANGSYLQDGCMIAKRDGSWRLYSSSGKEQEGFTCEDADVCVDGPIAVCIGGKWGFVDQDGEEVIAPAYDKARSFSGGVAAVQQGGKWGFIDEEGTLVVDCQFADVGYFSSENGSCPIQREPGGAWEILSWVMER